VYLDYFLFLTVFTLPYINHPSALSLTADGKRSHPMPSVPHRMSSIPNQSLQMSQLLTNVEESQPNEDFLKKNTQEVATGVLGAVLKSSTLGIAVFDRELRYLNVSEGLARINGLPVEQHIGRTVREILGPAASVVESLLKHVLNTGEPVIEAQITGRLPSKEQAGHWSVSYFPVKAPDGTVHAVGGVIHEITPQAELEDLMKSAIRPIRDTTGISDSRLTSVQQDSSPFTVSVEPIHEHDAELSARQTELVVLLANNKSNKEISVTLGIAVKTVETYRDRLYLKLHIHSIVELVKYALRHKLIEL
jgi:PAS domain S-box-containing protein